MEAEIPKPPTTEAEIKNVSRDLRAELQTNLVAEFTAKLKVADALPDTVCESLIALLAASGPTSADINVALALEDPIKPEVSNE
jgi:hypothetical protein